MEADFLWEKILQLKNEVRLTGVDIIMTWVKRRIQPLQA